MWSKFEVVSARTIDSKKKYIMYNIKIQKNGLENDRDAIFIERRYSDFLELFNTLRQGYPCLTARISFPKKVILGNFSTKVIKARLLGFENFLKIVSENNLLLDSTGFKSFLVGHEERIAKRYLKAEKYLQAKPLLEQNFKILNKILTEHHPAVIVALCRLAACCSAEPMSLEDASLYADLALRRFEGISDIDLLYHYIPLLQMCAHLWGLLGRDKSALELRLSSLKRLGHKVDGCPSLLESVLATENLASRMRMLMWAFLSRRPTYLSPGVVTLVCTRKTNLGHTSGTFRRGLNAENRFFH